MFLSYPVAAKPGAKLDSVLRRAPCGARIHTMVTALCDHRILLAPRKSSKLCSCTQHSWSSLTCASFPASLIHCTDCRAKAAGPMSHSLESRSDSSKSWKSNTKFSQICLIQLREADVPFWKVLSLNVFKCSLTVSLTCDKVVTSSPNSLHKVPTTRFPEFLCP